MTKTESKKILLIEDDKSLGRALKTKLELEDFNTELAVDGEDALKKFLEFEPDLIMLDILIPGKSGIEVLKSIRQKEMEMGKKTKIKVMVFSNIETFESISECLENNASDYYVKSNTSLETIVKKVKESLK